MLKKWKGWRRHNNCGASSCLGRHKPHLRLAFSVARYGWAAYLATNKKKEASTGLDIPWLPGPPEVWQFTQTALLLKSRSAVLHQAFSVVAFRGSACTQRLQPLTACTFCPKSI